jgi:hypothetical protein
VNLGLLSQVSQLCHGDTILADVGVVTVAQAVHPVQDNAVVEIVAAEISVAAGRQHFLVITGDGQNRDVEGAAAQAASPMWRLMDRTD